MSRAALKKELSKLTADQLVEVIMDAYAARTEIKEYFEYYLNPDVPKLTEKAKRSIEKELNRSKWGRSKARVSVINKTLKLYRSYSPGAENEVKFIVFILTYMGYVELGVNFSDSHWNCVGKLVATLLEIADSNCIFDSAAGALLKLSDYDYELAGREFKRCVRAAFDEYDSQKTLVKQ